MWEPDYDKMYEEHMQKLEELELHKDYPLTKFCPHGNEWGDCGTCDELADEYFDSER